MHKIGATLLGKLTICIDNAGSLQGHCIVAVVRVKTFWEKKRIYPSLVTKQQALIHTFQNLVACFDEHSRQAQPYFKNNNNFLLKANILVRLLFFVKEKKISNEKKRK